MKELKLGINLLELSYGECNTFLKSEEEKLEEIFKRFKELKKLDIEEERFLTCNQFYKTSTGVYPLP